MSEAEEHKSASRIETALERLSKTTWRLIALIIFIALGYSAIDNLVSTTVVIQPVSCPKDCVDNGFTPQVNAERLRASSLNMIGEANSAKDMPESLLFSEMTTVVIPSTTLSVGYIVDALRDMLGISNKHIAAGEIVRAAGGLSFMLRLDNRQIFASQIDPGDHDFSRVFTEASKAILRSVDPYAVAAFHSSNRATAEARSEAMRALAKFEGAPHYNKWLYNLIGTSFYREGKPELALAYYERSLSIDRNFSLAYTNIGNIYRDRAVKIERHERSSESYSDRLKSIDYYRNAIKINSKSHVAFVNIARAYRDIGDNDMAIRSYKALMRLQPDDVSYRLAFANMLSNSAYHNEAHEQFLRLSATAPANATVRNDYGAALGRSGRLGEAIEQYRMAIQLRPNYILALNNLGDNLLELDRDEEALEVFGRALALNDRSLRAQRGLRAIYERRGYDIDLLAEIERELR